MTVLPGQNRGVSCGAAVPVTGRDRPPGVCIPGPREARPSALAYRLPCWTEYVQYRSCTTSRHPCWPCLAAMDVVKTAVAPADVAHIKRRSRGGCIDCKKAKVKCDEARPTCGTCARRRHVCQGYANTKPQLRWQPPEGSSRSWLCRRTKSVDTSSAGSPGQPCTELSTSCSVRESDGPASELPSSSAELTNTASTSTASSKSGRTSIIPTTSRDASAQSLLAPSPRSLSSIPPGMIRAADEPGVKIYFDRHPFDLVINSEFVEEMNALTLLVLQRDPVAIGNTLAAIGQLYLDTSGSGSLVSPLTRRARTFARLRSMEDPSSELEQVLVMVLGLAAMEVSSHFPARYPILIPGTFTACPHQIRAGTALDSDPDRVHSLCNQEIYQRRTGPELSRKILCQGVRSSGHGLVPRRHASTVYPNGSLAGPGQSKPSRPPHGVHCDSDASSRGSLCPGRRYTMRKSGNEPGSVWGSIRGEPCTFGSDILGTGPRSICPHYCMASGSEPRCL